MGISIRFLRNFCERIADVSHPHALRMKTYGDFLFLKTLPLSRNKKSPRDRTLGVHGLLSGSRLFFRRRAVIFSSESRRSRKRSISPKRQSMSLACRCFFECLFFRSLGSGKAMMSADFMNDSPFFKELGRRRTTACRVPILSRL